MSEPLNEATDVVVKNLEFAPDEPKEFGPIMVAVITQVIIMIVQYCAQRLSKKSLNEPTRIQKFWVRRYVRAACKDRYFYKKHGERIVAALFKSGENATEEDVEKLLALGDS